LLAYVSERTDGRFGVPMAKLFGTDAPAGELRPYAGYDIGRIQASPASSGGELLSWTIGIGLSIGKINGQIAFSKPIGVPSGYAKESGWTYVQFAVTF
jgi:hemolysin activation/secretion protein